MSFDANLSIAPANAAGVSFRETMAGDFVLGIDKPPVAQITARLAMHATVHIDDIVAFVTDPQHKAGLTGHIDFPPLGMSIPAQNGVFGLFSPSGDPALRYMVYELAFQLDGQAYYLAGKKHVKPGGPWKLWPETTTLYTTLHAGEDASAAVIGAGVLRLGVIELLRLLSTVHATPAATGWQAAGAVSRFFLFFAGQLARTYLLRRPAG